MPAILISIIIIDIIIMYHGVLGGSDLEFILGYDVLATATLSHTCPPALLLTIIATPYPVLNFPKHSTCFILRTPRNKPINSDCLAFHFTNRDTEAQICSNPPEVTQQISDVGNLGRYGECLPFPSQTPGRRAHTVKSGGSAFQPCLQLHTPGQSSE